jgi:hypothetical protein
VLIAVSALTWPPLPAFGGLLLVLRRPRQPPASSDPRWVPIAAIAAGVVAAVMVGLAMYHYVIDMPYPEQKWADMIIRSVWPLTVALALAYVGIGVYALARPPQTWRLLDYVRDVRWWYIVVTIVAMAVVYKVQGKIVGLIEKQGPGPTTGEHLALITVESLRGPLVHVVLGVVYYGPILLIAIVCWPRVAAVVASWGPGAVLAATMAIVEALGTESRQIIHVMPFLVTATMVATQARWRSTPLVALFVVLTLAWSKIWLKIDYHKHFKPQLFPNQWFFMHFGPWASTTTYVIHGVCMVVTAIILLVAMRLWRPEAPALTTATGP